MFLALSFNKERQSFDNYCLHKDIRGGYWEIWYLRVIILFEDIVSVNKNKHICKLKETYIVFTCFLGPGLHYCLGKCADTEFQLVQPNGRDGEV